MDCERNDSDLEEDSELEALRLAALATLKTRSTNNLESVPSEKNVSPPKIPSTLSAVFNRKSQVSGSLPKGQYSWKNSANQQRRGRGRGVFPKVNPRSNLIVITPVSADGNDSKERDQKPQLSLPQHRWCQSVNEDSSSPKTYSKRGPSRFNRHDSSSESSDSDYDNCDNDSYSNETILQDENSTNFSQQTPEESLGSESPLRTRISSERRLSFQNTNLDNLQEEDNSKATYHRTTNDDKTASPNDAARDRVSTNYSSNMHTSNKSELLTVNGGSQLDKDYNKSRRKQSYLEDSFSGNGTATEKEEIYTDDPNLTQNDLRLELKKRMLKLRSENAELSKSDKLPLNKQVDPGSDDNQRKCVRDSDRTHDRSRSHRTRSSERRLSRSSPRDCKRSQSRDRRTEPDITCSPVKRRNREPSQSPNRKRNREPSQSPNRKRSWSRSPVKRHRTDSFSPDRNSRRDYSRSPSKALSLSIATQSNVRNRNSSQSPNKSRKRSVTPSPDRNLLRDKSRSPHKTCKGSTLASLDSKKDDSWIPFKGRKGALVLSPQRKFKDDKSRSTNNSQKSSVPRSPKLNRIQSPEDKKLTSSSPQSPQRKPRQKINWSPVRSHKRNSSRSPNRKQDRSRQERSRSPVQIQKRDSPLSSEKKYAGKRDKYSRHRLSRSSSLSSRSSTASSSSSYSPCVRSISSVIKPVQPNMQPQVEVSVAKRHSSSDSDFTSLIKKGKRLDEKPKAVLSLVKSSIVVGENRSNVSDSGKRLPVHMRLGTLPRNKLIRMTKDVEAAFVNSSSEDDANLLVKDSKKQNFRVVAEVTKSDVSKRRVEKSPSKNSLDSKPRRKKTYR